MTPDESASPRWYKRQKSPCCWPISRAAFNSSFGARRNFSRGKTHINRPSHLSGGILFWNLLAARCTAPCHSPISAQTFQPLGATKDGAVRVLRRDIPDCARRMKRAIVGPPPRASAMAGDTHHGVEIDAAANATRGRALTLTAHSWNLFGTSPEDYPVPIDWQLKESGIIFNELRGGRTRTRTLDPLIKSQLLRKRLRK